MLYVDLWDNDGDDNDAWQKNRKSGVKEAVLPVRRLACYVTLRFSQVEAKPLYTIYSVVLYSFQGQTVNGFHISTIPTCTH